MRDSRRLELSWEGGRRAVEWLDCGRHGIEGAFVGKKLVFAPFVPSFDERHDKKIGMGEITVAFDESV